MNSIEMMYDFAFLQFNKGIRTWYPIELNFKWLITVIIAKSDLIVTSYLIWLLLIRFEAYFYYLLLSTPSTPTKETDIINWTNKFAVNRKKVKKCKVFFNIKSLFVMPSDLSISWQHSRWKMFCAFLQFTKKVSIKFFLITSVKCLTTFVVN